MALSGKVCKMGLNCNKRTTRVVLWLTLAIFLVYLPLNIVYLLVSGPQTPSQNALISLSTIFKKGEPDKLPLTMKNIIPQSDGNVDVVFNINIAQLLQAVDVSVYGNPNGEATMNPLPAEFNITMHNKNLCKDNPQLQWIIYVHTAPGNIARRSILRKTWGNKNLFKDKRTAIVFLVGTPTEAKEQKVIDEEQKIFEDIVQGGFVEHYTNLTLKAILGLKWASQFCPEVPFALKADDDAFINIFELDAVLKKQDKKERLIICPLWKDNSMPILRDPAKCMKWCVKYTEFPGKKYFPKYCAGLGFLMSKDMLPKMAEASRSTPFFWIDDVYTTGLLAGKVPGVTYVDLLKNFTLKEVVSLADYSNPIEKPLTYIFAHVKKKENFMAMWNATLQRLSVETLKLLTPESLKLYPNLVAKVS